jgi:hypothetical protein
LFHLVVLIVKDFDRYFVCIIVQIDKAIVEEKATVALLSITIIHLLSSLYVVQGLNHKAASIVCVVPGSLPRALVVEHVSVGHKAISLHSLDLNAENTAGNHHADF